MDTMQDTYADTATMTVTDRIALGMWGYRPVPPKGFLQAAIGCAATEGWSETYEAGDWPTLLRSALAVAPAKGLCGCGSEIHTLD